jgi:hypothetical protein
LFHRFHCKLIKARCIHVSEATNQRCKRLVTIGIPYCRQHLLSDCYPRIAKSTITGTGLGLFADVSKQSVGLLPVVNHRRLVFRGERQTNLGSTIQGEDICDYEGDEINKTELKKRYGNKTAPYTLSWDNKKTLNFDGACYRSVGSLINASNTFAQSNCKFVKKNNPRRHFVVRARKNIYLGDELKVYYGDNFNLNERGSHYSTRRYKNHHDEGEVSETDSNLDSTDVGSDDDDDDLSEDNPFYPNRTNNIDLDRHISEVHPNEMKAYVLGRLARNLNKNKSQFKL